MTKDILIMKPLSGTFFGLFLVFLLLFTGLCIAARKRDEAFRGRLLAGIMFGTLLLFFVYKYVLFVDPEYSGLTAEAGIGGFNWWGELPLHLCNINMILIPIAVLTKKRPLMSFCFFMGPLGAAMALLMPSAGFEAYSLLEPRILCYFVTHWLVFFGSLSLCGFGLYKPNFRDILPTVITALLLAFAIFLVDILLRKIGVDPHSNYFFAVETEGNPILELFYSWLPYPFLYLMPCVLILVPYAVIVLLLLRLIDRLFPGKNRTQKKA